MGGIILLLVLAIVLWIVGNSMTKPDSNKKETYPATGTIQKVIYTDSGNAYYYVVFNANGKTHTGQSITYSSKTKTLNDGDVVKIQYYFTKSGRARVIIDDNRLIPCEASLGSYGKAFKIISFVMFVVAVLLLVIKLI